MLPAASIRPPVMHPATGGFSINVICVYYMAAGKYPLWVCAGAAVVVVAFIGVLVFIIVRLA